VGLLLSRGGVCDEEQRVAHVQNVRIDVVFVKRYAVSVSQDQACARRRSSTEGLLQTFLISVPLQRRPAIIRAIFAFANEAGSFALAD